MPAWITLTSDDLAAYLVGAQVAALRSANLAPGEVDPFTAIAPNVIARIRNKVKSCPRNRLSATPDSIPPELKGQTIALLLTELQTRLSLALRLTPDQQDQARRAEKDLDQVMKGDFVISLPDDPLDVETVQFGGPIQLVTAAHKVTARGLDAI